MIATLCQALLDAFVHVTATICAAVLRHEAVQAAGATMMVRAMNDFLRQPDLNEHVRVMSETMSKNQEDYARSAGQDFPKLAGQFIQGMLSPHKKNAASKANTTSATTTTTTTTTGIVVTQQQSSSSSSSSSPLSNHPFDKFSNNKHHNKLLSETGRTNSMPLTPPPSIENVSRHTTNNNKQKQTPTKSNSFLHIPGLSLGGGIGGNNGEGGLRQRLGSASRAS